MDEVLETVALAGNPNAGKSTLFNALTGGMAKVANYPGVTVSLKRGEFFSPHGKKLQLIDLPGCYSLEGGSPEQELASQALTGNLPGGSKKPDLAVCVVDASNLERHLVLALQVIETGLPVVIALNMVDVAEKSGLRLDPQKLSEELGVPVVPMTAHTGRGVTELKQAIRHPLPPVPETPWTDSDNLDEARREFVYRTCELVARRPSDHTATVSDKLDAVLLHPVFGWVAFIAVMLGVFWSIFSWASIPMGWIEAGQDWLSGVVENAMSEGDLRDLLVNGIIGGVGSVIVFLPQILFLFFFIGLLESTGYMARAAYLMDGMMSKVGLSGKAFLPLLSSYACAIPGVMATRTIDSAKERLTTIFVAPWMSCSARLPVYLLLIPLLIGGSEGGLVQAVIMTGLYAIGTLSAFVVAKLLRRKLGPEEIEHHFILELPPYRTPQWPYIARHLLERGWAFIRKAGTVILMLMILLWAAQTYPKSDSEDPGERLDYSLVGRISHVIEPLVRPMGFDGRTGTAILTSFAAREVFVGSMAQLYHVAESDSDVATRTDLRTVLADQTWEDGKKVFRPLTVISLLIFYIYALQCLPTSAVVARETNSWKWATGQFFFMSLFAALASLVVFQVGKLMGF